MIDQCPSTTKGEKKQASKAQLAATPRELQTIAGQRMWRSADEHADTPEFRDFVEREFPAGASELLESSRRGFLQVMGASLALAGIATIPGCRRPDHKIMTYSREVPEEVIPGKPLYYATSMPLPGGGAEGLLVETHEGRPTKLEGNPLHSVNQGKSSIWAQASILNLYNPDRMAYVYWANPALGREQQSWADFIVKQWNPVAADLKVTQGAGLAILVDKKTSPSREWIKQKVLAAYPKALWIPYESCENFNAIKGTELAFGQPMRELYSFAKAKVVVSFDRDFLNISGGGPEPMALVHARDFASTRYLGDSVDDAGHNAAMSRLYVIESGCTNTGAQADHRFRLSPTRVAAFAYAVAAKLAALAGDRQLAQAVGEVVGADIDAKAVDAIAEELLQHKGAGVVLAGPTMPQEVHALVAQLNQMLGNVGSTVNYRAMRGDEAASSLAGISDLATKIDAGEVKALVCINTNPAYDAPAGMDFAAKLSKIAATITLSTEMTETAAASKWMLPGSHFLESWGDTESYDGSIAPIQPMIAPLHGQHSDLELLALIAGLGPAAKEGETPRMPDGYEIVRQAWREALPAAYPNAGSDFDRFWKRALHDGVLPPRTTQAATPLPNAGSALAAVAGFRPGEAPSPTRMDVVFEVGFVHDGRFANNAWLQELPHPGTRVVWDNPALVSPKTAEALGITPERYRPKNPSRIYEQQIPEAKLAEVTINGRKMIIAAWILPGMADDTIILSLGYGRQAAGLVGDGVGFNVSAVRPAGARMATGATIARATGKDAGTHEIVSTQNHWSLEGRDTIYRQVDLIAFHKHGAMAKPNKDAIYGTELGVLNMAEKLGELSHTPPNFGAYDNPFNRSKAEPDPKNLSSKELDHRGNPTPPRFSQGPQWGMTIDLTTCTGCGACTIACQAENNIPVVGKREVAKGREMTWIRVDRYYVGDDLNNPEQMVHQPIACVHCENAPCETVCPVNATVHGPEGMNYMVYNRCIGTRYCANNCPYKVRRFNFFDYGVTKFNGGYFGKDQLETIMPDRGGITGSGQHNKINPNLIPPRLREKTDEIVRMQKNPDVTVRSRGVMEKCSYCQQRVNAAKIECKLNDLKGADGRIIVPDGFFQSACQQACPSNSIVFGDILDETSKVSRERRSGRAYMLLGYLNTRPRTLHLAAVRNPNPKLRTPNEHIFHDHGGKHDNTGPDAGGHGGEKGNDHGGDHGADKKAAFFDRGRAGKDRGYAMSLRVLSPEQAIGSGVRA
jgi:MoCo/4Fe-4S cofactor protein with predicted Tat translocation signal